MANEDNKFENDISRMLGSLKQIDPPRDFDVRVRARIAQGRPSTGRSWLAATASVAAAVLVLSAAGYFGFRTYYSATPALQAIVVPMPVEPNVGKPSSNVDLPAAAEPMRNTVPSTQPSTGDAIPGPRPPEIVRPKAQDKEQGGGSIDFSSKEGKRILPRGFNANPKLNANANSFQQGSVAVNDVLKQLGLDASSDDTGWRVRSVSGQAERSGLKAGDVVEAIDERSLVKKVSLSGTVTGKTLRVRRDGKMVEIALRP